MKTLVVENLVKKYVSPEGDWHTVLDIPRFSLEQGDEVILKGESGTGKTTFLNLIAGILVPDGGSIHLQGQEITKFSEARRDYLRAQTIGYVFQTFNLLQGYTTLENIIIAMMFGSRPDLKRAKTLLQRVNLQNRMHHYPRQLSVGQQQRVAVARALANQPKLVLADEPTGNLDRKHALEVIKLIRDVCKEYGTSLLLVTHTSYADDIMQKIIEFSSINNALAQS